jgi:folate-dependent phosphoribosylglycinamide formyltransferase PurN
MRVVILCPSVYSETSCAVAVRLARLGHAPIGALTLPTFDPRTLLRKLGQWGAHHVLRYAREKLISTNRTPMQARNPYLQELLEDGEESFRSLREVATRFGFPIVATTDHNAPDAIVQLKEWSPDLMIFTGGGILRQPLLQVPRLGVLNAHLGLLPEIRGMSSPEWSLLSGVPVGVTVHFIDPGIDSGPVLLRRQLPGAARSESLDDLRNRLIAFGIEMVGEVVSDLDRGAITAMPQSEANQDNQYFVMHEWLRARAAQRLKQSNPVDAGVRAHG